MPGGDGRFLVLFAFLPALSPKNFEVDSFRSTYLYIMVLMIGLFAYIHGGDPAGDLAEVQQGQKFMDIGRALIGGMFLFFALLGNVMGKVRKNFYIGVRVPWTLASDRVWNDTHRLAAWLMVGGGILGFVMVVARACRSPWRSPCMIVDVPGAGRLLVRPLQGARAAGGVVRIATRESKPPGERDGSLAPGMA